MLARLPGLVASHSSHITWFERELVPAKFTLERFAGARRLFDVDDTIWLASDRPFSEEIASRCYGVIAGSRFLADHYKKQGARVWIVPTSVNTLLWRPPERPKSAEWTIGWTGTSSNLKYLYDIEEPLADFLMEHPGSQLLVVCDTEPLFKRIPPHRLRFERWTPEREVSLVQEMDVGLAPLADTEWARGKCALKMLMYMAVGIPVVCSPVGANKEVLEKGNAGFSAVTPDDWYEALRLLFEDQELTSRLGAIGREVVEEHYSVRKNAFELARIFQMVACA
jgi:glycosyltransferase involved in cell wall biosynthesis